MEQTAILYNLWERICAKPLAKSGNTNADDTWNEEVNALYALGIGMEETMRFLYSDNPTYNEFKNWLSKFQHKITPHNLAENYADTEDVLTKEDLNFWTQNGYVVVKDVIPKQQCIDTQNAIWEFLDMRANDPSSWYKAHADKRGLMITFTQHPALDANRQSVKIQKAYEQLYATRDIYKTIDKVSFNPPETEQVHFSGSKLHWDVSLQLPIPFCLQGMLYLTDCGPQDGAFHCVPGFHHKIESWLSSLPAGLNPREAALQMLTSVPVPGDAGDFIIWHQALPHCATPNHGRTPRMVQYLTYLPVKQKAEREWK